MRQLIISLVVAVIIFSCQVPVKDNSSPAIESGLKRVETIICDNHAVGENGCVYPDGVLSGSLNIYSYFSGTMLIVSNGCGVDKKINYNMENAEWVSLDLKELLGNQISQDCVISILQTPTVPKQDTLQFPIYPLKGTVTIGRCPSGVKCEASFTQQRFGAKEPLMSIGADGYNKILVQACGETVMNGEFTDEINLNLKDVWPKNTEYKGNSGCLFIVGVKGNTDRFKLYNKIWFYDNAVLTMSEPRVQIKNNYVYLDGDRSTLYTITDGKAARGSSCKFKKDGVHYVRFYTSAGRTMVVMVKDGVVEWIK